MGAVKEKWTPGPWRIEWAKGRPYLVYGVTDGQRGRLNVINWAGIARRTSHEGQANARLISSAPDLYRQLEHLVALLEPLERGGGLDVPGLATLNGARAALAKARGEETK